jgi:hypothetical protein
MRYSKSQMAMFAGTIKGLRLSVAAFLDLEGHQLKEFLASFPDCQDREGFIANCEHAVKLLREAK